MRVQKNEAVMQAATLKAALDWEEHFGDEQKQLSVCLSALGLTGEEDYSSKLVCKLENELEAILESQRYLRANGMGTAPNSSAPKKVEGHKACNRCSGTGVVSQYKHVNGGRCYSCGGSGKSLKFL